MPQSKELRGQEHVVEKFDLINQVLEGKTPTPENVDGLVDEFVSQLRLGHRLLNEAETEYARALAEQSLFGWRHNEGDSSQWNAELREEYRNTGRRWRGWSRQLYLNSDVMRVLSSSVYEFTYRIMGPWYEARADERYKKTPDQEIEQFVAELTVLDERSLSDEEVEFVTAVINEALLADRHQLPEDINDWPEEFQEQYSNLSGIYARGMSDERRSPGRLDKMVAFALIAKAQDIIVRLKDSLAE